MNKVIIITLLLGLVAAHSTLRELSCTPMGDIAQSGTVELDFQCRAVVEGDFLPQKCSVLLLSDRSIVRNKAMSSIKSGEPLDFTFKAFLKDRGFYHIVIRLANGDTMISDPIVNIKRPPTSTWYNLTIATVITIGVSAAVIIGYSAWSTRRNKIRPKNTLPVETY